MTAFGGIDGLIYAAAYLELLLIEEATAADWSRTLETNVIAPALV